MQITNDYASTLDLFGTESTSANKTEEEQSGTTLFGLDGDSVTISDEARQLYAQQSASGEASAPAAQGDGSASGSSDSEDSNDSQIESQIQNLQGQLAALQSSGDSSSGEIAALQAQIASLKAQLS